MQTFLQALATAIAVLLAPRSIWGCPFCAGNEQGQNPVRDSIFNETFWPNLGMMALPFILVLSIVTVVYLGGSRRA